MGITGRLLWAGFGPLMTLTFSQILLDETKWRDHWRDLWPDRWPDHWPDLWPGKATKDYGMVDTLRDYSTMLISSYFPEECSPIDHVALLAIIRHYYCPVRQLEQHLLWGGIFTIYI